MSSMRHLCWLLALLVSSVLVSSVAARILISATPTVSSNRVPLPSGAGKWSEIVQKFYPYSVILVYSVDPDNFEIEDKDCSSLCQDAVAKPLCVARNTNLRDKKTVLNACVLRKVNCHYNDCKLRRFSRSYTCACYMFSHTILNISFKILNYICFVCLQHLWSYWTRHAHNVCCVCRIYAS